MVLDTPIIAAMAALAGSVVGACASVATTFLSQRLQARWSRLAAELDAREELYGRFVEEAGPLFIDAVQQSAIDPAKIMRLYSLIGHIRLTSSDEVLGAAETVGKRLLEAYARPPEDFAKFLTEQLKNKENLDPLLDFTETCRRERVQVLQQV